MPRGSIIFALGALAVSVGLLVLWLDRAFPKRHQCELSMLVHRPVAEVFSIVRDHPFDPRPESKDTVRRSINAAGNVAWEVTHTHGHLASFEDLEAQEPHRFLRRFDFNGKRTGTWEILIGEVGGSTRITFREEAEIRPLWYRVLSRLVMDDDFMIKAYFGGIGARLGRGAVGPG